MTHFTPTLAQLSRTEQSIKDRNNFCGLILSFSLISIWAISLLTLFLQDLSKLPIWFAPVAILWQTFFYTGLFITAHDAMHGSACPQNLKLNHWIGTVAVFSYGFFSYQELLKKHWLHHRYPASDRDPDFHDGKHEHPVRWYLYFMQRYWGWQQFVCSILVYQIAHFCLNIPHQNLILFWAIPSLLSSIQLFYFGTFLTHRQPQEGYNNAHRTQTIALSTFLSFITCYHFGYHEEHHEYPHVPWWQLPEVHKLQG